MRLGRAKGLLALMTLGMLLASTITCTVPLYAILMGNIQLQHTLTQDTPQARNFDVALTLPTPASVSPLDQRVRTYGQSDLLAFTTPAPFFYAISDPVLIARAGSHTFDLVNDRTQATLDTMDYSLAAPHMRLIAGQAPAPADPSGQEALITKQMADAYQLAVGDSVTAVEFGRHENTLTARVVGIWAPRDTSDPFWNGLSFDAGSGSPAFVYPILLAQEDVQLGFDFGSHKAINTGLQLTAHWVYYTNPHMITTANMGEAANAIRRFRGDITQNVTVTAPDASVAAASVATGLDGSLAAVSQQSALLVLPLYMVAAAMIGLALVFVATVAGMLVEAQAGEVATLKSRGLGGGQALGVFALQGILPSALALVVGTVAGGLAAFAIVRATAPLEAVTQVGITPTYLTRVAHPADALLPAGAAALLGYSAVVLTALRASRRDVLAYRREAGRPQAVPLWRQMNLDLVLAGVCAAGYLELTQFGGTGIRLSLGDLANSPLLFLTPVLLLLAGALLTLRVLPLVAQQGVRLSGRLRGLVGLLAFTSIARAPSRYARVALLLTLAVGLGFFAVTFDATLGQNAIDRAAYQSGADFRLTLPSDSGTQEAQRVLGEVNGLGDVAATSAVYRGQAVAAAQDGTDAPLDLLGVNPSSFAAVTSDGWRADYADVPLPTLLGRLSAGGGAPALGKPIVISDTMASALQLGVGNVIRLRFPTLGYTAANFQVADIVHAFPTLYTADRSLGFAITNLNDLVAVSRAANEPDIQANECWVKAGADAQAKERLAATLQARQGQLGVTGIVDQQQQLAAIVANPLNAGMRGLLLAGSAIALALAILTIVVQSALAARARTAQLAVLRTVGLGRAQLAGMLLGELVLVCALGMVGGSALGLLLTTATLPFLQFGDTTLDPAQLGVPAYRITLGAVGLAGFYVALIVALAIAVALSARYAYRLGLGRTLRVGED
jgi:ABC-type lipoprotein release transport system permease subunit